MNLLTDTLRELAREVPANAFVVPAGILEMKLRGKHVIVLNHPIAFTVFGDDADITVHCNVPGCRVLASHTAKVKVLHRGAGLVYVEGQNRANITVLSRGPVQLLADHGSNITVFSSGGPVAGRVQRIAIVNTHHDHDNVGITVATQESGWAHSHRYELS